MFLIYREGGYSDKGGAPTIHLTNETGRDKLGAKECVSRGKLCVPTISTSLSLPPLNGTGGDGLGAKGSVNRGVSGEIRGAPEPE